MQNKTIMTKISTAFLMLALLAVPQLSYADWGAGHHSYRWNDHPRYGIHLRALPAGYLTVRVGGAGYYYYDGLYYTRTGGDYIIINPPVGAYVSVIPSVFRPVIITGRTYYADHGVYYILTRHRGYKVVTAPVVYRR